MKTNYFIPRLLFLALLCTSAVGLTNLASAKTKPVRTGSTALDSPRGKEKYTICHKGHEISVAGSAVAAHLAHGDYLGSCGQTQPPLVD